MVAFRFLCVLLIGVGTVSAWYSCPDLFNDKSKTFNSTADVCVYMMDLETRWIFFNDDFPRENENDHDLSDLYVELVSQRQRDVISGRGYWNYYGDTLDVYYVAFAASMSSTLNETHPELYNADIEEYLLRQYMLTSFINCIPTNLTADQFSCYGGTTDERGEYIREEKTAYCRDLHNIHVPIEHGLDVCAYQIDFAEGRYYSYTSYAANMGHRNAGIGFVKLQRRVGELCRLHRNGFNLGELTGINDSTCLRRVGPYSYDILCCFYGNHINFEESMHKAVALSSIANEGNYMNSPIPKSFCAVVDSATYKFDFSSRDAASNSKVAWNERAPRRSLMTWSEFIESHFHQVCMSEVKYTFYGTNTEVTQKVYGLDNRTDCHTPQVDVIYGEEKENACPFASTSEINEMEVKYCCRGHLCNHRDHDMYARKGNRLHDFIALRRPCHRPLVFPERFPQFEDFCFRFWDTAAGKEFFSGNKARFDTYSGKFSVTYRQNTQHRLNTTLSVAVQQTQHQLLMDVEEYVKLCPEDKNPPGFIERRRAGIPWTTVSYDCFYVFTGEDKFDIYNQDHCDTGDESYMEKFDDSSALFARCHDHSEGSEVLPFAERQLRVNKESTYCFMKIREDDNYDVKVTIGSYNGSTSLSLYNEFNHICSMKYVNEWLCSYQGTLRTHLCCFEGLHTWKIDRFWLDRMSAFLGDATIGIREWRERNTEISCPDSNGFLHSCDSKTSSRKAIGCYMERQANMAGFEDSGCLLMGDEVNHESKAYALCEHELLNSEGSVAYCSYDDETESIFCCCRHDEDCRTLRNSYGSVLIK